MTIYQQIKDLLKDEVGSDVRSSDVKSRLFEKYGTNQSSIILSDYCYNRINDGIAFDKHIFQYLSPGKYKYLGENYSFTGLIIHAPQGQKTVKVVGEWKNGVKVLFEDV
ncbi:MAG: hypothetical protein AB9888_01320 [Bacteroidales bacterium]